MKKPDSTKSSLWKSRVYINKLIKVLTQSTGTQTQGVGAVVKARTETKGHGMCSEFVQ